MVALDPVISCMKLLHPLNKKDPRTFFTFNNYNLANKGIANRL
jgi:hypothetical protein